MTGAVGRRLALGAGTLTVVAVVVLALWGPIAQPADYHAFADRRAALGIPNAADTLSNLPFLVIGAAGLLALRRGVPRGALPVLRPAYAVFFAGAALLGPGSAYYHLHPDDGTLAWDRLPMTVAFMAFFAIVLGEHVDVRLARRALAPLVALGVASVVVWRATGDLRLYVLVQYLPMVLVPVIALAAPAALRPTGWLWALLVSYGAAKAFELLDAPVFRLTGGGVSGHTLKHLAAAAGIATFLAGLDRRRIARCAPPSS